MKFSERWEISRRVTAAAQYPQGWKPGSTAGRMPAARCPACLGTGYHGRVPVMEWLRVTDEMRAQICGKELQDISPTQTLEQMARELLARGLSDEKEHRRVFGL